MTYTLHKLTAAEARMIAGWRYEGVYAVYNPVGIPREELVAYLLEPAFAYHAVYAGDDLVGFCCFGEDAQVPGGDYSLPDTLDIGLGMRPDLTGQGRGRGFLAAILTYARQHYQPRHFRATIAAFNQRSQKTFAQAGFQPVQTFTNQYDHSEFVVMMKSD